MGWMELVRTGLGVEAWTLFGRLPVALLCVGLLAAGLRRGWAWRPALLATAALGAGASIGAALLPGVVGAITGGGLAWLGALRVLGLRRPPLVVLAFGLTLLVAVGRIGCHLAGCCFGTATDLPWAVHHDAGSAAFALHAALGHLAPGAASSLGVHPYPLYESLALLLWLPLLTALSRRLRSEGATLALTGAFDLAVRAGIDGSRAMVNVWWAKLATLGGLDLLQGAFALAALMLLGTALLLEQRARRNPHVESDRDDTQSQTGDEALAGWAVFGAAWLAGVTLDDAQTPFLHQFHVLTLLAAAPALQGPKSLQTVDFSLFSRTARIPFSSRAWMSRIPFSNSLETHAFRCMPARAAPLLALVLAAIPLFTILSGALEPASASADGPRATLRRDERRDWVYEVDHRRALLVRLGMLGDPLATLRARRRMLALGAVGDTATHGAPGSDTLPPIPETPAGNALPPVPDAPADGALSPIPNAPATNPMFTNEDATPDPIEAAERRAFRHWLGLALAGGLTSYTRVSGCGGPSTLVDREGFAGWLRYEALRGLGESAWSLRFGGSAGAYLAATREQIVGESIATHIDERLGFANGWIEIEEPRLSVGLAVYGDLLSTATQIEGLPRVVEERLRGRIGGHLRAGFSQIGIEAGYLDRDALLGPTTFRLGFVGMLGESGRAVRHMSEVRYRYGLGVASYPAVDRWIDERVGFYAMGELRPTERLSLGLQAAWVENGAMLGATVMLRGD
jgi:hypothetical protein